MICRPELCTEEKLLSYAKYYYIDPDPLNPLAAQILRQPIAKEDVLWPEDVENHVCARLSGRHGPILPFEGGQLFLPLCPAARRKCQNAGLVVLDDAATQERCRASKAIYGIKSGVLRIILIITLQTKLGAAANRPRHPVGSCAAKGSMLWRWNPLRARPGRQLPNNPLHPTLLTARFAPGLLGLYQCLRAAERSGSDHSVTLQFFRETDYGCEAIFRTWRGYAERRRPHRNARRGFTPTKEHVLADLMHNPREIPHLAKFLPQLYAEGRQKPVDAY